MRGKAEEREDMNQAIDMEVVEETLYVEEKEGSDVSCLDAGLCRVRHGQDGVDGGVAVP